jgi:hypothetical protein
MESFLGEGEAPASTITAFNDTTVSVVVQPGVGTLFLTVLAMGQFAVAAAQVQYAPPSLTAASQRLFSTDGGESFTLFGANFGPPTMPVATAVFTPTALPLSGLTRPVTALLVVRFGWKCAVLPASISGQSMPAELSALGCSPLTLTSRTDGSLVLVSVSGIGANRTLEVSVVEPVSSAAGAPLRWLNASAPLPFSYAPPMLQYITPAIIGMDSRSSGYVDLLALQHCIQFNCMGWHWERESANTYPLHAACWHDLCISR